MTSPRQKPRLKKLRPLSRVWAFPGFPGETVELTLDRLLGRVYFFLQQQYRVDTYVHTYALFTTNMKFFTLTTNG